LFYDVFREFDPSNLLLTQAEREVAEGHLDVRRLRETLERLSEWEIVFVDLEELSPMSFPLFAEALRTTTVSSEGWDTRVRKLVAKLEQGATLTA
jgi:ATP-dependent Lhr-like helicase